MDRLNFLTTKRSYKLWLIAFISYFLTACMGSSGDSNSSDELPPQFSTNVSLNLSEEEKITLLEEEGRPPLTIPSVDLYISDGPEKPLSLPNENPVDTPTTSYKKSLGATFIERGKNETRWLVTQPHEEASSIIWQIADTPFVENDPNWQMPTGLLSSGSLGGSVTEFQLDFAEISALSPKISKHNTAASTVSDNPKLNPTQSSLFARAVAVDRAGQSIGNISQGIELVYGASFTETPDIHDIQIPFPLLSGKFPGSISTAENGNPLIDVNEHFYLNSSMSSWYFRPSDYPSGTHTFYIQVLNTPPSGGIDNWRDPAGLVHEIKIMAGQAEFDALASNPYHAIPVDIQSFASTSPSQFYIRAVALRSGSTIGSLVANYSKTVIIKYGDEDSDFTYYTPPEVIAFDANLPDVRLLEYQPIRWQYSDWMYYYEVVRQPTQKDYYPTLPVSSLSNPNGLIDSLPVGEVIHLTPPPPEDTSWLQDAWNSISDFFSSISHFLADVANWVSESYADMKADLVAFVAENLPLVPEDLRDELNDALSYGLDYGLASVGIPPSLPNFDELSNMGADYIAATALEQAGIPATAITTDTVRDLGDKVGESINSAANNGGSPNPLNWNFVKPYAPAIYRQAYIQFQISNPSSNETPPGILKGKVFRQLESSELSNNYKMDISAAYGGLYFELYRPVSEVHIPRLLPGQTLTIPIFLKEYTGQTYPWSDLPVQPNDFLKMYNHFDSFKFSFNIEFILPPAQLAAIASGEPSNQLYEYALTSKGFNFTGDPAFEYKP